MEYLEGEYEGVKLEIPSRMKQLKSTVEILIIHTTGSHTSLCIMRILTVLLKTVNGEIIYQAPSWLQALLN